MNLKEKIETLKREIEDLNYKYYVLDISDISDFDFDNKLKELIDLEKKYPEFYDPNSPSQKVGGTISKTFESFPHKFKMFSLDNTYNLNDLIEFEKRIKKIIPENIEYICELKYDGASISIEYENGEFKQALTRGDGQIGEDVSNNVKTIKSIPLKLKKYISDSFFIRGEIILTNDNFEKINKQNISENKLLYSNPRNLASGTLKLLDSKKVAERNLDCIIYGIESTNLSIKNHDEIYNFVEKLGFKVPKNYKVFNNIEKVYEFINYWDKERFNLPYQTDGIVIKVNSIEKQKKLGFTSKYPKWAVAYKFKPEKISTKILSVEYQVGRTGVITPVANLEPVLLSGTIVKRASLHNQDQMNILDLCKNDYVFVEKGGEIIPKITGTDKEKRSSYERFTFIKQCPECNSILIKNENESNHYCPNENNCTTQIKGKIEHFISKKAMNIEGIGSETIDLLFKNNLIKNIGDLYNLKKDDLLNLERMAEKSSQNIIDSIIKSKEIPFEKVFFALGIRHVGETVAKKIVIHFKNIDNIINATIDDFLSINEIGIKIAESIYNYFRNEKNITLIEKLKSNNIQFIEKEKNYTNSLTGKIFVVSGGLKNFSREQIKEVIENYGGKNTSSISLKTSFLLMGENAGEAKKQKALELNIPIITENEFIEMLKN